MSPHPTCPDPKLGLPATDIMLPPAGHEQDARVLQQQLGQLVSEQQEAMKFIRENPSEQGPAPQSSSAEAELEQVHWKWDILRPVSLSAVTTDMAL